MAHFEPVDGYEWHREVAAEINAAPESERLAIATKRCYDRVKGDELDVAETADFGAEQATAIAEIGGGLISPFEVERLLWRWHNDNSPASDFRKYQNHHVAARIISTDEVVYVGRAPGEYWAVELCKERGFTPANNGHDIKFYERDQGPALAGYEVDGFGVHIVDCS